MDGKLVFYANFKGNKDSYIESRINIGCTMDSKMVDQELINWVKRQLSVEYSLISVDVSNNYTFEFNAILNGKKHKGVYSVFSEKGEKHASKAFNYIIKDYLIRDIVEYDKDELFDEEE